MEEDVIEITREEFQRMCEEITDRHLVSQGLLKKYVILQTLLEKKQKQAASILQLCESVAKYEAIVKKQYAMLGWNYSDEGNASQSSCKKLSEDQNGKEIQLLQQPVVALKRLPESMVRGLFSSSPENRDYEDELESISNDSDGVWQPDEPDSCDSDYTDWHPAKAGKKRKRCYQRNIKGTKRYAPLTPSAKSSISQTRSSMPPTRSSALPVRSSTPVAKSSVPIAKSSTPAAMSSMPSETSSMPSAKSTAPSAKSTAPAARSSTPSEMSSAPAARSSAPSAASSTPAARSSAPSAASSTPAARSSTPSAASSTPAARSSAPSAASSAPAARSSAPSAASSAPAARSSTPSAASSAPAARSSTPSAASSAPAARSSTPPSRSSTPSTTSSMPETSSSKASTTSLTPSTQEAGSKTNPQDGRKTLNVPRGTNSTDLAKTQNRPAKAPPVLPEVTVGMTVLARKKALRWYRGKILEIINKDNGTVKYKVLFENDQGKVLVSGHHIAYDLMLKLDHLPELARVLVKPPDEPWFCPGVLAERPGRKNRMRFLVFLDDQVPIYVSLPLIRLVCKPLPNPWDDISDEEQKKFIEQHTKWLANPPLTQCAVGQKVNALYKGVSQKCSIVQVDNNLVEVLFAVDQHKEWLYRGSPRLEHIVTMTKQLQSQEKAKK